MSCWMQSKIYCFPSQMKSIKIKFWGVRGSIPTPGYSTLHYGGNTSCVEVAFKNGPHFILDAGTGIRELGKHLQKLNRPLNSYILLSHFHWDHIQGLPFFRPAFNPKNKFTIIGSDDPAIHLDKIISFQMDPTYFPITIDDMRADISFRSIKEERITLDGVDVQTIYLNHPGYALGFRISYQNSSLIYISDNEPFQQDEETERKKLKSISKEKIEEAFEAYVENKNQNLIEFCEKADLLIHDTQYLEEEYKDKITWGHSPLNFTVELAMRSKVKQLVLFHHDPDHDDAAIDRIEQLSKKILRSHKSRIACRAAKEGMTIEI